MKILFELVEFCIIAFLLLLLLMVLDSLIYMQVAVKRPQFKYWFGSGFYCWWKNRKMK